MSDKRTGWLAGLKVDDLVFVEGRNSRDLKKVHSITKSGAIKIEYKNTQGESYFILFDYYGRMKTSDKWDTTGLWEATEERIAEHKKKLKRKSLIKSLKRLDDSDFLATITTEQLEAMYLILSEKK